MTYETVREMCSAEHVGSSIEGNDLAVLGNQGSNDGDSRHSANGITQSVDFGIQSLRRFLVGRTAMDCSILFAFAQAPSPPAVAQHAATVVDLDLKELDKLPKWIDLDSAIVEHYTSTQTACPAPSAVA